MQRLEPDKKYRNMATHNAEEFEDVELILPPSLYDAEQKRLGDVCQDPLIRLCSVSTTPGGKTKSEDVRTFYKKAVGDAHTKYGVNEKATGLLFVQADSALHFVEGSTEVLHLYFYPCYFDYFLFLACLFHFTGNCEKPIVRFHTHFELHRRLPIKTVYMLDLSCNSNGKREGY